MSFLSQLASAVATNLVNSLTNSVPIDPFKVVEVSSSNFVSRPILNRENFLIVYGNGHSGVNGYELVVLMLMTGNRDKMYSLCRTNDLTVINQHFQITKDKLPILCKISLDLCLLPRLQDVWSIICSNPYWNAAHIIAHYGIIDGLKESSILMLLSVTDESNGMTPMHIAAKNGRSEFIKSVIAAGLNLQFSVVDSKGNSLYHYASQANKETVEVLATCYTANTINARNEEGYTPLHLACLSDKPECVKGLIAAGANINMSSSDEASQTAGSSTGAKDLLTSYPNQLHAKDMKNGGSPLHWAITREVVIALVELGCSIEERNFSGQTALHVMVQRDRFECIVALLSRGADPNVVDKSGNSPLHYAATLGNLLIVQGLVAFGADVNMLNDQGESPRHLAANRRSGNTPLILHALHAVGAKRCSAKTSTCVDGCSPNGKDDGQSIYEEKIPRTRHLFDAMLKSVCHHSATANQGKPVSAVGGRILCLDGGGIRGLILIQMLEALELYLGGPVINYFDWIAGTSTGGILSLALASGKSIKECKGLYLRFKDQVFVGKRPYDADLLEGFLRNEFGQLTMADLHGPKILVTAVVADTIPSDLHIFRNYPSPQDLLSLPDAGPVSTKKAEEQLVWQAARASGAAPTYFRAFGSYLDGGLIANNPTLDVLTEVQEFNAVMNALGTGTSVLPSVVVSLGTGSKPTEQANTLDLFRPESLMDAARLAFGASAFGKLLVDQVTSSDRRVVDRARAWCTMVGAAYYRLSPSLSKDIALDEIRHDQLVPMLWETKAYIHHHQADFKRIAQLLKS